MDESYETLRVARALLAISHLHNPHEDKKEEEEKIKYPTKKAEKLLKKELKLNEKFLPEGEQVQTQQNLIQKELRETDQPKLQKQEQCIPMKTTEIQLNIEVEVDQENTEVKQSTKFPLSDSETEIEIKINIQEQIKRLEYEMIGSINKCNNQQNYDSHIEAIMKQIDDELVKFGLEIKNKSDSTHGSEVQNRYQALISLVSKVEFFESTFRLFDGCLLFYEQLDYYDRYFNNHQTVGPTPFRNNILDNSTKGTNLQQSEIVSEEDNYEKETLFNVSKKEIIETFKNPVDELAFNYFDIVIQYTIAEPNKKIKTLQIIYKEEINKLFSKESLHNIDKCILLNLKKQNGVLDGDLQKIITNNIQQIFEEEMAVHFDQINYTLDKERKKHLNEKLDEEANKNKHLQIVFLRKAQEEKFKEKSTNELIKNVDEEFINKYEETQNKSDLDIEDSFGNKFKAKVRLEPYMDEKNSDVDVEEFHNEIQENSDVDAEIYLDEIQENSDIDVEELSDELQDNSDVGAEKYRDEIQENSDIDVEELSDELQEDSKMDTEELLKNEINVVEELVEDFELEDSCYVRKGKSSSINESTTEQFMEKKQVKLNINKQESVEDIVKKFKQVEIDVDEKIQEIELELEDLQLEQEIENMENMDEDQKEKLNKKLYNQYSNYLKDFYSKQECHKKQQLNDNNSFNSKFTAVIKKQRQKFFSLRDEYLKMKEKFDKCVQNTCCQELQKKTGIQELSDFPEDLDKVMSEKQNNLSNLMNDMSNLDKLYNEFEPEFMNDLPLEFEYENSKPFDLFEELYATHYAKLAEYRKSNEWPNYLIKPSGLLDALFESTKHKINVLVITLYPKNIGYSTKIIMKLNKPPVENFYSYDEKDKDSILSYVENEKLHPKLLKELDDAEQNLFYNNCVVAEIHDRIAGNLIDKIHRLLLRPSNETVLKDVELVVNEYSYLDWTFERKLELERDILLASKPMICIDSMPIAGLALTLQHQLLSTQQIILNPLKKENIILNYKSSYTKVDESNDDGSDTSDESQSSSSELMDIHYLLWKFDYRLKSSIIFNLYVMINEKTLEFSILLDKSLNDGTHRQMRFKMNQHKNELQTYILTILEILKKKNPDIEVIRKFKFQSELKPPILKDVPKLFDVNIYEPNYADLSQVLDLFLNNIHNFSNEIEKFKNLSNDQREEITYELSNMKLSNMELSNMPVQSPDDTQELHETNLSPKVDHKINVGCNYGITKKLSKDSNKYLDMSQINLHKVNQIVNPPKLKTEDKSQTILSPEEYSIKTKLCVEPPFVDQLLKDLLNDPIDEDQEKKIDLNLNIECTQITDLKILPVSNHLVELPPLTTVTSLMSNYLIIVPSTSVIMSPFETSPIDLIDDTFRSMEISDTDENLLNNDEVLGDEEN